MLKPTRKDAKNRIVFNAVAGKPRDAAVNFV